MAYYIFLKDADNMEGTLFAIAEKKLDLDNLNINKLDYKIIEDNNLNFNDIKFFKKRIISYTNNIINTENITTHSFEDKKALENNLNYTIFIISKFIEDNKDHHLKNDLNSYLNQLNQLNLDDITYPFNKSLAEYFNDLGQLSFNPLQLR